MIPLPRTYKRQVWDYKKANAGDIITNFSEKADLFHKYFADQCTPLNN